MTTAIDAAMSLAEIVNEHPDLARELEGRSLDYCCGGPRSLAQACAEAGLDLDQTIADLSRVQNGPPAPWASLGPSELVDHLQSTHHEYLHDELPRLAVLVDKVVGVHGDHHPELAELAAIFTELRAELEPHLIKEELVLFPMIRELADAGADGTGIAGAGGSVRNPISVMLIEHDRAGALLARVRAVTGEYEPPEDACASYAALYVGLEQLESDTHLHVHKENNLLFPAVIALERRPS